MLSWLRRLFRPIAHRNAAEREPQPAGEPNGGLYTRPATWENVLRAGRLLNRADEVANRVGLDDFLAVHGARLTARCDEAIAEEQRQLTDWLVTQVRRIARPLVTLNRLASAAERGLVSPELDRHQTPCDRVQDVPAAGRR